MLQIRLSKAPASEGSVGAKAAAVDSVTVACPDHLVLADLPVAKGIGAAIAASLVKTVGRRSRRQLGERVHFCVRCDFPIAIYGRLSPCEHAFCLDCARSDSICYLCDERIQKIQTIKLMEGIFICAAPHCLKSFLKRVDFESHIQESHAELLQTNADKEDNNNESEAQSVKQSSASESTLRAPLRPGFSPSSNSQIHDREDKNRRQLVREQSFPRPIIPTKPPQAFGQVHANPSEVQPDYRHQGFDNRPHNPFQQQNYDSPGALKQDSGTQGVVPESPFPDRPAMPPNYVMPFNPNQMMNPSAPYGYLPFMGDGSQTLYNNTPYDMGRPESALESAPESGPEQGSLLGFPPTNNYHHQHQHHHHNQPWNGGQSGLPFERPQGVQDGFTNASENQGKAPYYQTRDGKGILAPQPMPHSLPPPPPPHMSHPKRKFYSEMGRDGQGYGWQHENRDGFGSGQD